MRNEFNVDKVIVSYKGQYAEVTKLGAVPIPEDSYFDSRNHMFISGYEPGSIECGMNYLNTCAQLFRKTSKPSQRHLVSLGFLPIGMLPIFAKQDYVPVLLDGCERLQLPIYRVPATSFRNFGKQYSVEGETDIWVHKLDVVKCIPKFSDPFKIRASEVFKEVMESGM